MLCSLYYSYTLTYVDMCMCVGVKNVYRFVKFMASNVSLWQALCHQEAISFTAT